MKFLAWLNKFMYGRYGTDELNGFILKIYIFILILDLFIRSRVLLYIELILFIILIYRSLSKKIYKRSDELVVYLNIKKKLKKKVTNIKRKYKDRKDYIYKKCPKCKKTLKLSLPRKRGMNHTSCPKCKKRITIFSWRKERIEIIKEEKKNDKITKKFN